MAWRLRAVFLFSHLSASIFYRTPLTLEALNALVAVLAETDIAIVAVGCLSICELIDRSSFLATGEDVNQLKL